MNKPNGRKREAAPTGAQYWGVAWLLASGLTLTALPAVAGAAAVSAVTATTEAMTTAVATAMAATAAPAMAVTAAASAASSASAAVTPATAATPTAAPAVARADTWSQALARSRPLLDMRLRYESVDQDGISATARALTARARAGFQTARVHDTVLLGELSGVARIMQDYREDNSVVGVDIRYPVVADPPVVTLNRLQLTNTSLQKTTITLGRQRINLDDQRFVGNSGWRQTEQTFDALRVVNTGLSHLTVDVTYAARVNRVYGPDSPQGRYFGDVWLLNLALATPVGKLSAFSYLLDLQPRGFVTGPGVSAAQAAALNPARASTNTSGLRFAGDHAFDAFRLGYTLSWAHQTDRGRNSLHLDHDYRLAELSGAWRDWKLTLADEVLDGDGTTAFNTPLATLHAFQGWADKFLSTPAQGLDDRQLTLAWNRRAVGPFTTLGLTAALHDFRAEHGSGNFGQETDLQLVAGRGHASFGLKYADYHAASSTPITVARSTRKAWAWIEYKY